MIDARELRIGNWVKTASHEFQVDAKFIYELAETEKKNFVGSYNYIELSEEWLIKFGFEKRKTNLTYFIKDGFTIIKRVTEFAFDVGTYDIAVRHVHQLQNLFYALCGTDLELHP